MLVADVSGQSVGSTSMGQAVQEDPLKMGTIGCPETSVTTNLHCVIRETSTLAPPPPTL